MNQTRLPMPNNARFVLFGALGDLAWRLVVPALFDLYRKRLLPELIGIDQNIDNERLIARLREGATLFSTVGTFDPVEWDRFAVCLRGHSRILAVTLPRG
jgi:glucose-6-phosphate 1-dehydrogenase